MSKYLIPANNVFVDAVAKAIAHNRMREEANQELESTTGMKFEDHTGLEGAFEALFERLWETSDPVANSQKASYRGDAEAAIRAINLKLLTIE